MNPMRPSVLVAVIAGVLLVGVGVAAGQCDPKDPVILSALDQNDGQEFGRSVAVDGDLLVVGADGDDDKANNAGAAYVYRFKGGAWIFEQKLKASDGAALDAFGDSVAIRGSVVVVGAPFKSNFTGAAYVFRYDGAMWKQQMKLTGPGATEFSLFGRAVGVSEDSPDAIIAVGAPTSGPHETDIGAVYLYRHDGDSWKFHTELLASDGERSDLFGLSLALDQNRLLVGAPGDDDLGNASGSVYYFSETNSVWSQEQKFGSPDPFEWQGFGKDVSLLDGGAAIGTAGYDENCQCSLAGAAYTLRLQDNLWVYEATLLPPKEPGFSFGQSIAIGTDTVLVGAPDGLAAYLFRRAQGGDWARVAEFAATGNPVSSYFGWDVALNGTSALVGDVYFGDAFDHVPGAAFVFDICGYLGCYADLDGSGELDLFDFLEFMNLFNAGDDKADCDGSGELDLFDFLCYVNAFNEGCG